MICSAFTLGSEKQKNCPSNSSGALKTLQKTID